MGLANCWLVVSHFVQWVPLGTQTQDFKVKRQNSQPADRTFGGGCGTSPPIVKNPLNAAHFRVPILTNTSLSGATRDAHLGSSSTSSIDRNLLTAWTAREGGRVQFQIVPPRLDLSDAEPGCSPRG